MKSIVYAAVAALLIGGALSACHKSTAGKIQGKWQIVSINGEVYRYVGKSGDYFDFQSNGNLVEYQNGIYDTFPYTISNGDNTVNIYASKNSTAYRSLNILTLTGSSLILRGCTTAPIICILDSLYR